MSKVFICASVKEFDRIKEYYKKFDYLEIDINCVKGSLLETINQYKNKIYSVHLEHSNLSKAVESFKYVKPCLGKVAVFHPDYPKNFEELIKHLEIICYCASQYSIPVMIENLCDRKRKSGFYDGGRNPITICSAIKRLNNNLLGLCLDTGHAVSNELTEWKHPLVYKWLKHIHLSDNVVGKDLHLPFSSKTSHKLKSGLKHLLNHSTHNVMIILENKTFEDSVKIYKHIEVSIL